MADGQGSGDQRTENSYEAVRTDRSHSDEVEEWPENKSTAWVEKQGKKGPCGATRGFLDVCFFGGRKKHPGSESQDSFSDPARPGSLRSEHIQEASIISKSCYCHHPWI